MANIVTHQNQKYHTGDMVRLHLNVTEGDKTRVQVFEGMIIKISGSGIAKSLTVRKIGSNGIGVERIVPLESPVLTQIERRSVGKVRRAKLYYLRDRIGKRALKVKTKDEASQKTTKTAAKAKPKKAPAKKTAKAKAGKAGGTASKKATAK